MPEINNAGAQKAQSSQGVPSIGCTIRRDSVTSALRVTEYIEGDRIADVWNSAKAEGWTGKQTNSEKWEHFCPSCSNPFNKITVLKQLSKES